MAITRKRTETFINGSAQITVEYKQQTTNIENVSAISINYDDDYIRMYERDFLAFAELVDYVRDTLKQKGVRK